MSIDLVCGEFVHGRKDRRAILLLQEKIFHHPRGYPSLHKPEKDLEPWLQSPDLGTVVAYDQQKVVGYAFCSPLDYSMLMSYIGYVYFNSSNPPFLRQANSIHGIYRNGWDVKFIAVHPQRRKEGIGKLLLNRSVQYATEKKAPALYASCWQGEDGDSYKLFLSSGFKKLATLKHSYPDGSDLTVVCQDLNPQ